MGLGAGVWASHQGFSPQTAALAAGAALTGGLIPDLDADQSRPLKMAATLTGLAVALVTLGWPTAKGLPFHWTPSGNLSPLWPPTLALMALVNYFGFNALVRTLFRRFTKHRGLFHSLAVPFFTGGLWALALANQGLEVSLLVGLAAAAGVFSHLLLDALASRSLNPLKLYSANKLQSAVLWLATSGLVLIWFIQVQAGLKIFKLA